METRAGIERAQVLEVVERHRETALLGGTEHAFGKRGGTVEAAESIPETSHPGDSRSGSQASPRVSTSGSVKIS